MDNEQAKAAYAAIIAKKKAALEKQQQMQQLKAIETAVKDAVSELAQYLLGKTTKTEVTNQLKSISTPDVQKVVDAVNALKTVVNDKKVDISPLATALEAVKEELKNLPEKLPKPEKLPASFKISNLSEIDLKSLSDAIKELSRVKPQVNVAAPNVKVDAPNLNPLTTSMQSVVDAITGLKIPKVSLEKVENELKTVNEKLQKLVDKPVGGSGGGGGNGTPYTDPTGKPLNVVLEGDGSIPVTVVSGGSSGTPLDTYSYIQKDTSGATYKYYGYADANTEGGWAIKRITIASNLAEFVKGTTNYTAAWAARNDGTTHAYADIWSTF